MHIDNDVGNDDGDIDGGWNVEMNHYKNYNLKNKCGNLIKE